MPGPFATVKRSRRTAFDSEREKSRLEQLEQQEADEKSGLRTAKKDKVADFLNENLIVTNHTWPWLVDDRQSFGGAGVHMTVDQFFPNIGLAVDKVMDLAEYDEVIADMKKRLCNAHGVKYCALHPGKDLVDMQIELEAQKCQSHQ